jgi:hypothetical protein
MVTGLAQVGTGQVRHAGFFPHRAVLALLIPVFFACSQSEPVAARDAGRALFDGRTLSGWVTRGGHYNGNADWTVENGVLTGRQNAQREGGLIYTDRPYTEFVLTLECRLDWPFDSGIFLRMAPHGKGAQITLDYRPDGEIGAIYADGFLKHNPSGIELWKKDDWNKIEVRATGKDMRVAVQLNGKPLVDFQMPPESEGYAPTGLIGLQVHGDRDDPAKNACRFRNIRIQELSTTATEEFREVDVSSDKPGSRAVEKGVPEKSLTEIIEKGVLEPTPWGRAQGWTSLFDVKTLGGWEPADGKSGYDVRNGQIVLLTNGDSGYLRTQADFQDFALRLDFKLASMTNSGVFLRGDRRGGDPAWTGCEVQVLDDFDWERVTKTTLEPWQHCGSLYGSVPPKVEALKPIGEWNTYEIECRGTHMSTKLNGQELWSVDTNDVTVPEGKLKFAERVKTGFIGLQRHAPEQVKGDAYAWFRNLYVRPL